MPKFSVQVDGKWYEIEAPDGESARFNVQRQLWAEAAKAEPPSRTIVGMAKSGAAGVAQGAMELAGLPGTIADVFDRNISPRLGWEVKPNSLSGEAFRRMVSDWTDGATEYVPRSTAERYAQTVGGFVPGAVAMGGGGLVGRVALGAVVPGIASEAAGQAVEGTPLEQYEPLVRTAASLASPLVASRLVPRPAAARVAASDILERDGVTAKAGQVRGNRNLAALENEFGTGDVLSGQLQGFTNATLKRAGIDASSTASEAIPELIEQGMKKTSDQLYNLAGKTTTRYDDALENDLLKDVLEYQQRANVLIPDVEDAMTRIADAAKKGNGIISGETYRELRGYIDGQLARAGDKDARLALSDIQASLDNAVSRSMTSDLVPQWQAVREQHSNLTVARNAVALGAAEKGAPGVITPSNLGQAAAAAKQGRQIHPTPFYDTFADAGKTILTPLPKIDKTTPVARGIKGVVDILSGLSGAKASAVSGDGLPGIVADQAVRAVIPPLIGYGLAAKPVQNVLSRGIIPITRPNDPRLAPVIQALISQEAKPEQKQAIPRSAPPASGTPVPQGASVP